MIKRLLSPISFSNRWFIIVRIITGIMIVRYGLEVFNKPKMDGNIAWLTDLHFPVPAFMAFFGKGAELIGGVFLMIGYSPGMQPSY
jgi:putative oxidoreductase